MASNFKVVNAAGESDVSTKDVVQAHRRLEMVSSEYASSVASTQTKNKQVLISIVDGDHQAYQAKAQESQQRVGGTLVNPQFRVHAISEDLVGLRA